MSKKIPLSEPFLQGNEQKYVRDCISSGWISSSGKYVDLFEKNICRFTGAKYAVAMSSGTAALQIALQIIGVEARDEVIVPTLTFIATVNAVSYLQAKPIFMDCDNFYNLDVAKTIDFIEHQTVFKNGFSWNKKSGRKIRAIVPVHILGNAVDLPGLEKLCKKRNIRIVEDATESLGTFYRGGAFSGKHTGTIGDVGCFSFNGNKIITTGGGGMLVTNSSSLAKKARYLATQAKDDAIRYIHHSIGYNFRLSNVQAAIGVAQLEALPGIIRTKKANFNDYKRQIDPIKGLSLRQPPSYADNNHWMYALRVDKKVFGVDKEGLMKFFKEHNVDVRPLFYLNHLQKPYRNCQTYRIENAYKLLDGTLNIPCSASLKRQDINKICRLLKKWKKK